MKVQIEVGPKEKRYVAVATEWPGLERGGKTEEQAIDKLGDYLGRYSPVARLAAMATDYEAEGKLDVVERYTGLGSTDFWGISFGFSNLDRHPMSGEELERLLTVMQACWSYFDSVRFRVSAEMQRGPRGGGRDRETIVQHVLAVEQDWARKLKLGGPNEPVIVEDEPLKEFRSAYCEAIRRFHTEGKPARNWPIRYLVRHIAYHAMDHAWEMEDKDLGASGL